MIGKFVCFIMFRSRSAISTTRNFVQSCVCAHVRFDLRHAEIALGAICDFNYARMQIEMYEPGYQRSIKCNEAVLPRSCHQR